MLNFEIYSPCEMEIIEVKFQKNNGINTLLVEFNPSGDYFQVPIDGQVSNIKPFNYYYELKSRKKNLDITLTVGENSQNAFGFGFDMKVVVGQPVSIGDRLLSIDREQLLSTIDSLKSSLLIQNSEITEDHAKKLLLKKNYTIGELLL